MTAPSMAGLLEALPHGRRVWITARGRSLWPLLRGGEQLQVQRCGEGELEAGDLAVLLSPEQGLVTHVVVGTSPLQTASFNGRADPTHWTPLGRVTAIKVAGRAVPLPRKLIRSSQRAWSSVARLPPAQLAWSFLIATWSSSGMRRVRSLALGPVEVRLARPSDRAAVIAALAMHEVLTDEAVGRLLDGATEAIATGRGGTLGVAIVDRDGHLTRARLLRRAAGQGIEQRLVDLLLNAGLRSADISSLKPPFATALARRGVQPAGLGHRWARESSDPPG